jgi:hypothetical protein
VIAESGRELQRRLLEAAFAVDCAREERAGHLTSAAGIRHGSVETGHDRGVVSIFGPVRATRKDTPFRKTHPIESRLADPPGG